MTVVIIVRNDPSSSLAFSFPADAASILYQQPNTSSPPSFTPLSTAYCPWTTCCETADTQGSFVVLVLNHSVILLLGISLFLSMK
ncbi:hypothetical protein B296_00024916 [Ensete ventricosum]|uniref:Uncharacterized protein n=1 Tax=Ensete ventricosum TaxID=4639 RepID=A0A427A7A0_ENSVE|nr:hypothetical protein B296_00024916 [Ensete ventricosum]